MHVRARAAPARRAQRIDPGQRGGRNGRALTDGPVVHGVVALRRAGGADYGRGSRLGLEAQWVVAGECVASCISRPSRGCRRTAIIGTRFPSGNLVSPSAWVVAYARASSWEPENTAASRFAAARARSNENGQRRLGIDQCTRTRAEATPHR